MGNKKKFQIGIDFGTCNIKASRWNNKKNEPRSIALDTDQNNSDRKIPNAIAYVINENGDLEKHVGEASDESFDPDNTVENIKYYLQQKDWESFIPNLGRTIKADEVLKDIFEHLKYNIQEKNEGKELDEVAITVPVCFSEIQKKMISDAAAKSGLPIRAVITEPLAAALSMIQLLDEKKTESKLLIFDFGGATLDLSLISYKVNNNKSNFSLLASNGMLYGGIDINNDILDYILLDKNADLRQYLNQNSNNKWIRADILRTTVEKLKRNVSKRKVYEKEWSPYTGDDFSVCLELKMEEFDSMIRELQIDKKIIETLEDLLELASVSSKEVSDIAIIGGSSRIPFFKTLITKFFSGANIIDIDEDDMYCVVANGAVRYLNIMEECSMEIEYKLPYSIGYNMDGKFERMITRGSRYGVSSKKFKPYTIDGNVVIYQKFGKEKKGEIVNNDNIVYMGYFDIRQYIEIPKLFTCLKLDNNGKLFLDVFDGSEKIDTLELEMR